MVICWAMESDTMSVSSCVQTCTHSPGHAGEMVSPGGAHMLRK